MAEILDIEKKWDHCISGYRPEGFEPSAVQAGKPTRLCFQFESWAGTIISILPVWWKSKEYNVCSL